MGPLRRCNADLRRPPLLRSLNHKSSPGAVRTRPILRPQDGSLDVRASSSPEPYLEHDSQSGTKLCFLTIQLDRNSVGSNKLNFPGGSALAPTAEDHPVSGAYRSRTTLMGCVLWLGGANCHPLSPDLLSPGVEPTSRWYGELKVLLRPPFSQRRYPICLARGATGWQKSGSSEAAVFADASILYSCFFPKFLFVFLALIFHFLQRNFL